MTIKREIGGKKIKIELTADEVMSASSEYELENYASDVESKLQELVEYGELPITVEQLENIPDKALKGFAMNTASIVDNDIGKCDPYFEAFWGIVENVLKERINWSQELPKLLNATD